MKLFLILLFFTCPLLYSDESIDKTTIESKQKTVTLEQAKEAGKVTLNLIKTEEPENNTQILLNQALLKAASKSKVVQHTLVDINKKKTTETKLDKIERAQQKEKKQKRIVDAQKKLENQMQKQENTLKKIIASAKPKKDGKKQ